MVLRNGNYRFTLTRDRRAPGEEQEVFRGEPDGLYSQPTSRWLKHGMMMRKLRMISGLLRGIS